MSDVTQVSEQIVRIPSGDVYLDGLLNVPTKAIGLVLFVHGSGSSRFSVRNQYVAKWLNKARLATLLFDLLTPSEDLVDNVTREFRFNIRWLASRLIDTTTWCLNDPKLGQLPIGYFGASTGGGAALVAAAEHPNTVQAVVSRGGRPDLAAESLSGVLAPTLLIVGGLDDVVITLNQNALAQLKCIKQLDVVPGATHLFEEPGTLDEVARLAEAWFVHYLKRP